MRLDISRHFVTLGDRQIHYRRAGSGPPVVVLHQSPTSSRECEPLMRRLLERHTVFAPDMPGYGASDPLNETLSIERIADRVAEFLDALGIDRVGVYGFHTGASVATALARRHAPRVCVTVAVGLLCPTAMERDSLLRDYLPPFVPQWDGSHLAWLWSRVKDQSVFFPWFERSAAARVSMDGLPPAGVQANLPDWLRAGERYASAYEAAFRYRAEDDLPHLVTPHFIVDFAADPLFEHLDRLPAAPPAVRVMRCATIAAAHDIACDLLGRYSSSSVVPIVPPVRSPGLESWHDYVSLGTGQMRILRAGDVAAPPLLLQHGAQSSLTAWRALATGLGERYCVFALELPGHGDSDALPDGSSLTVETCAEVLRDAVRELGVDRARAVGIEAGAAIHVALAAAADRSISALQMISPIDVTRDAALCRLMIERYPDAAPPDFFGGHLLREWHMARDHLLFFPWYERRRDCAAASEPRLNPRFVQQCTADALLAGTSGVALRRAEIGFPLLSRAAGLSCPMRFAAPTWSPRLAHSRALAGSARDELLELRGDSTDWIEALSEVTA